MLGIFLIIYLSYKNALIAKLKGRNATSWVLLTVLSYLFFYTVGASIVIAILVHSGQLDINALQDTQASRQAFTNLSLKLTASNPIHLITMEAFGIGGYLLVRYILENLPVIGTPKKEEDSSF